MTKKATVVGTRTRKIINEITLALHLNGLDRGMLMSLENFIGSNLLAVYYEGYTDGLQKAREIAFPELQKKVEK
jgi:hypothetical protein